MSDTPDLKQITEAAQRIRSDAHETPVMTSTALDARVGASLFFKCENFQRAGAFKFRGACNTIGSLGREQAARGVATHSSGNHGGAVALAARRRGMRAVVVMPENANRAKRAAVREYGGEIVSCGPTQSDREEAFERILAEHGCAPVHPYDDPRIISGQGTAALELLSQVSDLDVVITPVGGGGLLSGTAIAVTESAPRTRVIGAEPQMADDTYRSFAAGRVVPIDNPATIADGLRTTVGDLTFPIIRERVEEIMIASEDGIRSAMRLVWERMKIIIEPSAAVPLAALIESEPPPARQADRRDPVRRQRGF